MCVCVCVFADGLKKCCVPAELLIAGKEETRIHAHTFKEEEEEEEVVQEDKVDSKHYLLLSIINTKLKLG